MNVKLWKLALFEANAHEECGLVFQY